MPNRLINEQSQYLLQHANNPVDWRPWGDEAFDEARRLRRPVIVSIGYAACHWCHVMERESFEHVEVAQYMNDHFVCIKVDREERPDVDHLYMDAVQAISGSGGWPLNVFVTPDRVPFYGGTYYPPRPAYNRPSWVQLMKRMVQIWETQPEEIDGQARQMVQFLRQAAINGTPNEDLVLDEERVSLMVSNLMKQADREWGGFGNAPKFPGTMAISLLLEYHYFTNDKGALGHALLSLDAMANGGIYDHLGGGFARYATDREWLSPHFEKMLYDNALLIGAYSDAYAVTSDERYRQIVTETIEFVDRELAEPTGGFYCALDADSEGVEGKYYTWSLDEWNNLLGVDAAWAAEYFDISTEGNWEHTNIMRLNARGNDALVGSNKEKDLEEKLASVKSRLFLERQSRVRPLLDDKCLLSWNALMNTALSKAGGALGDEHYTERASRHMEWMLRVYDMGGELMHTYKDGVSRVSAHLDDYAFLIQAMINLSEQTGDNSWIARAVVYLERVIRDFSTDDGFFYFTAVTQVDLPIRKVDVHDGATPSGNAIMAENLWKCGIFTDHHAWVERAQRMVVAMAANATRNPYSFGQWGRLVQRSLVGVKTAIYSGEGADEFRKMAKLRFLPHVSTLFCTENERALPILKNKFSSGNLYIFVCSETSCLSPVNSGEQALRLIENFRKMS